MEIVIAGFTSETARSADSIARSAACRPWRHLYQQWTESMDEWSMVDSCSALPLAIGSYLEVQAEGEGPRRL